MQHQAQNQDQQQLPDEAAALMRMVDFRIPLPWLLGGFMFAAGVLISMYFQLQKVTEGLADLQITVRAGNNQSTTLAGEIALLKYRVENLESSQRNPPQQTRDTRR